MINYLSPSFDDGLFLWFCGITRIYTKVSSSVLEIFGKWSEVATL